nr:UvrD-helicase domain-containing protein [Homoserinimonas sp. OAct 916]
MSARWRPSSLGNRIARTGEWELELDGEQLTLSAAVQPFQTHLDLLGDVKVGGGFVWPTVEIPLPERTVRLRGLPRRRAKNLARVIGAAQADLRHRQRVHELQVRFDSAAADLQLWEQELEIQVSKELTTRGWLTREFAQAWADAKEAIGLAALIAEPDLQSHIAAHPLGDQTIRAWRTELVELIISRNERHLADQLVQHHDFFNAVERSPLTPEQARAVVNFENRVLVVAAAGSGKTSTMVAKAGYAMRRSLIAPEKILLLAFNNAAAKELQQRIHERLTPLGLDAAQVTAQTFHAFGLNVIGQATGRKPSLAPWLDGGDIDGLGRIVEKLRVTDPDFRSQWDFFRAVLARDYPDTETDDSDSGPPIHRTAQGEVVKSAGERMIADWLYFNGVDYEYERPYEIDTASADFGQYHPDFYYPTINAYHEHWAVNANGEAPEEFVGYQDGMRWKRATHQQNGTTLLETTMAELWSGTALPNLADELTARGIRLQPNPERMVADHKPAENARLLQTFRSFLTHAKSNRLSDEQLSEHLHAQAEGQVRYRDTAFLRLFTAIRAEWEAALAAEGHIDFEDMLNLAADHLEAGEWESPYELVMVDEFQDASRARARLARALVARPGGHLFAVGDDWQSINRFAGADLQVMTGFTDWFGPGDLLRLERTFRFPQSIADVSSKFVLENPGQISKCVVSTAAEFTPTVEVMSVAADNAVKAAIRHRLSALHRQVVSGEMPRARERKLSVLVLGRYWFQSEHVPNGREFADELEVKFMTVHASKGAEADYVVIPGMVSGTSGFPSTIPNDPVLRLAMPGAEDFPKAEERRLFYVAMTRARRAVLLVTVEKRESRFVMELIRDHGVIRTNAIGEELESIVCPKCARGFMVRRSSKRGPFLGCRRYPRCKSTLALEQ